MQLYFFKVARLLMCSLISNLLIQKLICKPIYISCFSLVLKYRNQNIYEGLVEIICLLIMTYEQLLCCEDV